MADDQKNIPKEFLGCCEGMPFAEMMRKMMEAKKAASSCDCRVMMSRMMKMCKGTGEKKEEPTPAARENPAPHQ